MNEYQDDKQLAEALAARLDAGAVGPQAEDDPELQALLSTYARLQATVSDPDPGFHRRLEASIWHELEARGGNFDFRGMGSIARIPAGRQGLALAFSLLLLLACVAGSFGAFYWVDTLYQRVDDQQTIVLKQPRLAPGSDASLRVVVQNYRTRQPISGAHVKLSLKPARGQVVALYEGYTDETGSSPVYFYVPADAPQQANLVIEADSVVGHDWLEQPVVIQPEYRLLLSSDKPLYQPGQVIHMRVLALSVFDLKPAGGAPVDFLVEDAKGNKVFRRSVTASDFGVAAVDFSLADLVNQGQYKLSAAIGEARAEKTVEVRPYVLPKFDLELSTERSFYLPGQRLEGSLQADYFFGKPVAGGQVRLVGSTWDVTRTVVIELHGQTDENGRYAFAFDLPAYFAGSGLDAGQASFVLEAVVTDQAEHTEQVSSVLPIAAHALLIEAMPESGVLKAGVENVVYILTSYPDGRPAAAQLQVQVANRPPVELSSDAFGMARLVFEPFSWPIHAFTIVAQDESGQTASRRLTFDVTEQGDSILLRADRALYRVGEAMHLLILTPAQSGYVYLDVIRAGQVLSTRSVQVQAGRAEVVLDVSPDMIGTLELHAYRVTPDGTIVRDTKVVMADAPNDLDIAVSADRATYRPGEVAQLDIHTRSAAQGTGLSTSLGLAVVDESVFALQRQEAGFARLYFLLEQALQAPAYQVKDFDLQEDTRQALDDTTKAAWAWAPVSDRRISHSQPDKMYAAYQTRARGLELIEWGAALALLLIPLLVLGGSRYIQKERLWPGAFLAPLFVLLVLVWPAILVLLMLVLSRTGTPGQLMCFLALPLYLLAVSMTVAKGHWLWRRLSKTFAAVSAAIGLISLLSFALLWNTSSGPFDREKSTPPEIMDNLRAYYRLGGGSAGLDAPASSTEQVVTDERARPDQAGDGQPPRLRAYFPETLYWAPDVRTDPHGFATLEVPMADSITTWRLTALASSLDGRLGFSTYNLRVFQDFFVDIDLPVALTQGDIISIPVGVFNYLPQAQPVRLEVKPEAWFELLGGKQQTLRIAANDIEVAYFPIRVLAFGQHSFQVTAWGKQMSDAIRREVSVAPDGKAMIVSNSDWLRKSTQVAVNLPPGVVPGTAQVEVKLYPGVMAQVVEGLEKILRLPHG